LNCLNLVTWKYDNNKSYRDWWVLQLLCSWIFSFETIYSFNMLFHVSIFLKFKIWFFFLNKATWEDDHNNLIEHDFRKFSFLIIFYLKIQFEVHKFKFLYFLKKKIYHYIYQQVVFYVYGQIEQKNFNTFIKKICRTNI